MLTQEEFDEEAVERHVEEGEKREHQERMMMMKMTMTRMKKRDMKVSRILSHVKPDEG